MHSNAKLSNLKIVSALALAAGCLGTTATAHAGQNAVAWDNPAGLADTYSFTDGSSSTGRYNDPIVATDTLLFTPSNYIAESDGATYVSETLCVTLTADSGLEFSSLSFAMGGDYAVNGQNLASAGAFLSATNLDTNQTLSTDQDNDFFSSGDGLFDLAGTLQLPGGWSNVLVKITGDLFAGNGQQALAASGSSALQFKGVGLDADTSTAVVPVPAAAFAAPLLMVGGLVARKRFARKR